MPAQPDRIRIRTRYLDVMAETLDEAMALIDSAFDEGKPTSVGLLGNAAEILPETGPARHPRRIWSPTRPRPTTRSTATSPSAGRSPSGKTCGCRIRRRSRAARASMAVHVRAMLDFQKMGIPVTDYGNNIRQVAFDEGVTNAFDFPGFVPAYIRPLFCRGIGPFRWARCRAIPKTSGRPTRR
jgi:urocanate hydratase